jgi:predicted PurR-regulated permease PerM
MKINNNKVLKITFYSVIVLLLCIATIFFKSVIKHFVFALIFSFLFNPLVNLIENLGIKRIFAVIIFFVIFFLNVFLLGSILIPKISEQVNSFSMTYISFLNNADEEILQLQYMQNILKIWEDIKGIAPFIDFESVNEKIIEQSRVFIDSLPTRIAHFLQNFFKLFTYMLAIPICSFFLLKDKALLKSKFYALVPNKYFEITLIMIDSINGTIGKYLRALLIENSIVATLNCIVLTSLGVKFSILIGCIAGLFNIIPFLGPLVGLVLGVGTVILTGGSVYLILFTALGMWCVQILDNAIIYPMVMGKTTNLHPVIVILTVIAGGIAYGIVGMLLAVPTLFLAITLVKVLYKNLKQFEII